MPFTRPRCYLANAGVRDLRLMTDIFRLWWRESTADIATRCHPDINRIRAAESIMDVVSGIVNSVRIRPVWILGICIRNLSARTGSLDLPGPNLLSGIDCIAISHLIIPEGCTVGDIAAMVFFLPGIRTPHSAGCISFQHTLQSRWVNNLAGATIRACLPCSNNE
jgi:hypothetical protein